MKNGNDVAARVVEAMERLGVDYMLAGSFSSNLYGIPRSTKDADFVAVLGGSQLSELQRELGGEFEFDAQPSFETVTGTFREMVRVKSVPFDIEIFHLSKDAHDQSRFERRVRVKDQLVGREIHVPTAEDVVVTKLRWGKIAKRDKDRDDVRNIIAVQGDEALDWDYIHRWCEVHGTRELLDEIRASIPPID
ncbi:MAG: hypothetical protein KDM63_20295 [Verrucomicrobiae bacterium]|nr:hypothetical protein [Verrucomicrobiae bacterium]MCB1091673.1 hypothetical protein [Verrucomicrobiae bacterium]